MIDLHMHSFYSEDGEYSPSVLAAQCAAGGISLFSVTDHNCAKANREAAQAAKELGIAYLAGIEIDCMYRECGFHLLGYGIAYESPDFEWIEQQVKRQGYKASIERLKKTQSLGFSVTENDMWQASKDSYWKEMWTGELFAEVLLACPQYREHPLLLPYRRGGIRSDNPYVNFYWDYYAQGKPCYVPMEYPSMEEMIRLIHRNGGLAVLAHPGVNLEGREDWLKELTALGLDGIEAFSSYHLPAVREYYADRAKAGGLFITCGSDYHGKTKPAIALGQHGCLLPDTDIVSAMRRR